ncbi:MAG: methanethiol S-methyltransferase [Planctomycetota bacterium]|jgi:protein-S-isoprenylcysteine O-methyltransferase Ste14
MRKIAYLVYGSICYLLFLGAFLYAIGFVGNIAVPKSIDTGTEGSYGQAILVNVLLLGLFAVQHTIMARPGFKKWWTRFIPQPLERSTFVLFTVAVLTTIFWQWRPLTSVVWQVDQAAATWLLRGLSIAGFGLVLYATVLIDHFDLFGLRQVVLYRRGQEYTHPPFAMPTLYKLIRHPLYLGFIIGFWSTPVMTHGHLLFSIVTTAYMLFGIQLEERDLLQILGEDYRLYRERTPMILPWPKKSQPRVTATG